jgi:hypothetical protein
MKKLSKAHVTAIASALVFCSGAIFTPAANAGQTSTTPAAPATNPKAAPAASAPKTAAAKPKTAPTAKSATPSSAAPGASSSARPSGTPAAAAGALTTEKEKASYALGMNIATGLKQQMKPGDIDNASLVRGIKDALAGAKPALSMDDAVAALKKLQDTV